MTLRESQTRSTLFDALRGASVAPFSSKIQASLSQSMLLPLAETEAGTVACIFCYTQTCKQIHACKGTFQHVFMVLLTLTHFNSHCLHQDLIFLLISAESFWCIFGTLKKEMGQRNCCPTLDLRMQIVCCQH